MSAQRGQRIGLIVWWQVTHCCGHTSHLFIRKHSDIRFLHLINEAERVAKTICPTCERLKKEGINHELPETMPEM